MPFVLDNSVTMAWCFEDEANPYTEALLDRVRNTRAFAPAIWPLEVANALLVGERRGRLRREHIVRFVQLLQILPITVINGSLSEALGPVLELGRQHRLSAYDAAYLELAMREDLPLATQDTALRAAAARLGVSLV